MARLVACHVTLYEGESDSFWYPLKLDEYEKIKAKLLANEEGWYEGISVFGSKCLFRLEDIANVTMVTKESADAHDAWDETNKKEKKSWEDS